MSHPKLVRVKDPTTGVERTTGAQHAKNKGLTPLDKPATDSFGRALPAKRPTNPPKQNQNNKEAGK